MAHNYASQAERNDTMREEKNAPVFERIDSVKKATICLQDKANLLL